MTEPTAPLKSWAIVEIMGHQVYAGQISEETIAGQAFLRVDVPETPGQPAFTKYFETGSIYAITPVKEDIARVLAVRHARRPVSEYDLPTEWRAKLRQPLLSEASPPSRPWTPIEDRAAYDDQDDDEDPGDDLEEEW